MSKTARSIIELIFVVVAVSAVVIFIFHYMSLDGILPGNDPAVHLGKTKDIIGNTRVTYLENGWYPPLFHIFLAVLLLLSGTVDIFVASLIVKLVVASIEVLLLLSTYLLARRILGKIVAVYSAIFIMLFTPLYEIIQWGGYPNFLGLAFISLIFYIMVKKGGVLAKICPLFVLTFALVLTHQLATFVFFLLLIPALLITARRDRKYLLILFAIFLASGLAVLAWYAEIILRYSSIVVSHVFFEMEQYTQVLPMVSFRGFIKTFGGSIFLAVAGLPLILVLTRKKGEWRNGALLILLAGVPFLLSQSYLLGVYLPYERFVYFLVTPIAILSGTTVYALTKLPVFVKDKILDRKPINRKTGTTTKVATLIVLITIFSFQGVLSFQRISGFPEYYDTTGRTGYDIGQWLRHSAVPNTTVVVSEKPGAWLHIVSNRNTIEEINPLFERNVVAETVLHLFYEMENSHMLTREQVITGTSGQELYVSRYNLWKKIITIPDDNIYVIHQELEGKQVSIPMSETTKEIYWRQKANNKSELVCEYSHPIFTLKKEVTMHSDRLGIDLEWKLKMHRNTRGGQLRVFTFTSPSLNFTEAFIPGSLKWQNPWDDPTYTKPGSWAVIEYPPKKLENNITALFDANNNILAVFGFNERPDWLNVGALDNRAVDAVRIGYELKGMEKNESLEVSFSIASHLPERMERRWNTTSLKKFLNADKELAVEERDFPTYIERYNIQFVVVHYSQLLSKADPPPILDRKYDNREFIGYRADT